MENMGFTASDEMTTVMESQTNSTNPVPTVTGLDDEMENDSLKVDSKMIGEIVTAVFAVLLVLGLAANFLVVYVTIVTNRTAKHPIHSIFVLNLAISDVIFLVTSGPYWIVILTMPQWRFGSFLCAFFPFMTTASVCSAIYTISALAWIRYMALAMPFRFRGSCMSTRKAGYIIVLSIWISGCLLSMPYLFNYKLQGKNGAYLCDWAGTEKGDQIHSIVKLITNYLIPLVLVIVFYSFVAREVLCYMMHRKSMMGQEQTKERKECMKSTVVMLFLITAFLICWFPHLLETVFSLTDYHNEQKYWKSRLALQLIGKGTAYAHAIVNPIIYTFASPIFRHSLRLSLRNRMRSCRNPSARNANMAPAPESNSNVNNGKSHHNVNTNTDLATTRKGDKNEANMSNPEKLHMLTADSHATEVTRLASPDLSHAGRRPLHPLQGDAETEPLNRQHDDSSV